MGLRPLCSCVLSHLLPRTQARRGALRLKSALMNPLANFFRRHRCTLRRHFQLYSTSGHSTPTAESAFAAYQAKRSLHGAPIAQAIATSLTGHNLKHRHLTFIESYCCTCTNGTLSMFDHLQYIANRLGRPIEVWGLELAIPTQYTAHAMLASSSLTTDVATGTNASFAASHLDTNSCACLCTPRFG